jgi:hypothetical protein
MKDLKVDINKIWHITLFAKENYMYARYFYLQEDEKIIFYVHRSIHWQFIRQTILGACIVELCKIIVRSKNNRYNIFDFISNLEKGNYGRHSVPVSTINDWGRNLSLHSLTIEKLKRMRDKAYTHTDPDYDIKSEKLSFLDIKLLFEVIEDIIRDVYQNCFESTPMMMTPAYDSSKFDVLEVLVKTT